MTDEPIKEDPVQKFRKLIASFIPLSRLPKKETKEGAKDEDKEINEVKMEDGKDALSSLPKKNTSDKLGSLPKKADAASKKAESTPTEKPAPVPSPASKPDLKLASASGSGSSVWGPRLWTTASVISLTINVLLTVILIILVISVHRLKLDMAKIMEAGTAVIDLPGGLYENFEKMERANIQTNVVVNTTIPVKFDLQLNQQTNVVLSQDVTITNARVTVNTGGLNISQANTTIVLPAGTVLPVNLTLTVPVDQQVPVTLNVPVNIPLKETQLNDPFVGLQNVIKPLYCLLDPQAVNIDKQPICQ
ncbi:MAG: hypothetical protein HYZ22_06875 [Chloroflexi bacterium]|nr:hypothetical protein [Chloroflexota bacterium]